MTDDLEDLLGKLRGIRPLVDASDDEDDPPRAAVAAILRPGPSDAELFFIRRAERAGDPWSGHIAFPGGRREAKDATLLDTAIRETFEEVGIDLRQGEIIARLPDLPASGRAKRTRLTVAPFVFVLRGVVEERPNAEVADTLWVPFGKLARGEGRGTYVWTRDGQPLELPCIRISSEEHVLWGMTYRMLETMLEDLASASVAPPESG